MFGRKLEQLQQVLLADLFAAQIFGGIFCSDVFVFFRAPERVVHAVDDADEPVGTPTDDSVQSVPVFSRLNFLRVFTADRGEVIGEDQSAFEKIYASEKLDSAGMKDAHGDTGAIERISAEQAVVTHVVNGEDD